MIRRHAHRSRHCDHAIELLKLRLSLARWVSTTGGFVDGDQAVFSPTDAQQPSAGLGNRNLRGRCQRTRNNPGIASNRWHASRLSETREVRCARAWIEATVMAPVLLAVAHHVDERVAHGARCRQIAAVPTICPKCTAPKGQSVDTLCNADLQTAHPCDESSRIVCLHDEMDMGVLHGKVNNPKRRASPRRGPCDGCSNRRKNELTAHRPKPRAQCNVHRMTPAVQRSRCMRHLPLTSSWLSSRPAAPAAPGRGEQHRELFWNFSHHSALR